MNLYEYIHILCYIFIYSGFTWCLRNEELKISKMGVEPVSPCAVGLKFYVDVNNTSVVDDYDVELVPDQCCLEAGSVLDCEVLEVVGSCVGNIPKGKVSTLRLIAPILDPYERKGYCLAYLDSKAVQRKRNVVTMRDAIKIPFDTRLKYLKHDLPSGIQHCKGFDEDPLNQCQPVDCDLFYNGRKSFYSRIQKRCVEVPSCVSEEEEIPNTVYDLVSNKCIHEDSITKDDFDYIKELKHSNKDRIVKDIVIIKKLKDSPLNLSGFNYNVQDKSNTQGKKSNKIFIGDPTEAKSEKDSYGNAIMYFIQKNKSSVIFMLSIIALQCGFICLMIYFLARKCLCKEKKLEKKYFNYRQDVSVTTPLIGVTTVETETETTCQFMSESSHIDKKIQCYKACQKENAKLSLSDDILSKCLNRRNWDRKQVKSEAVDPKTDCDGSKTFDTLYLSTKKEDQKLVFENNDDFTKTYYDQKSKPFKNSIKKDDRKRTVSKKINDDNGSKVHMSEREVQCLTYKYKESNLNVKRETEKPIDMNISEKEIKCHSYNYGMDRSDEESIKASSQSYSDIQSTSKKQHILYTTEMKAGSDVLSIGRQVSAQASFSNDSIDEYLSERGIMFLAGENISKYSFSDNSIKSVSSRTSKNNIMKHVLSYLKRDKHGPSSDPGSKKHEHEVNLELIHMSKANMYSSSNTDTECLKNISRVKDSRTSL